MGRLPIWAWPVLMAGNGAFQLFSWHVYNFAPALFLAGVCAGAALMMGVVSYDDRSRRKSTWPEKP